MLRILAILGLCALLSLNGAAQTQPRIAGLIDESILALVPASKHPSAIPANDLGRVQPGLPMERLLLVLKKSADQQLSLDRLLADQQDPASSRYHQWLTPEQFGEQFGAAPEDLAAMTHWLESHGLRVNQAARGRGAIEFSGTARQVETAFHTEMHRYRIDGAEHLSNSAEISIPAALAPVIEGVLGLNDFRNHAPHHVIRPDDNFTNGTNTLHALAPYDFATIYNVLPLWNTGYDGTGQSIAIVARSNINLSDITTFRSTFGLSGNNTQIIVNGSDPGVVSGDEDEAILDSTWSGAVAKGATIKFVVTASTKTSDGSNLSAMYIVDNNIAPVMSMSFSNCEATANNSFFNNLWSQAASQGISVFVSSGDDGSAGCDDPSNLNSPATQGLAVSGIASTPYNVAVGGTSFNDNPTSSYWNSSNDANFASARSYIPEIVWNESSFTTAGNQNNGLWAGSGGVSTVYSTPSWQTGNGVPTADPGTTTQHHRYLPDVSLDSAAYVPYDVYENGSLTLENGTSAAAPSMAGIMAIVNQFTGGRNGNPNPRLYALAAAVPSIFHDVTSGNNEVPCAGGSPNCTAGLPATNIGHTTGYSAGPGYDLATGWGSVDVHALASNWSQPATHFSVSAPGSATAGSGFSFTVTALTATGATATSYAGTVRFTSTDPNATLPGNAAFLNGVASFPATLKTPGSQTITATDISNSSITGTSAAIIVSSSGGGSGSSLVVTALTGPATAIPGSQINASMTITNQGSAAAGQFLAEFYFSSTSVISTSSLDTTWGCQVSGLAAGAAFTCNGPIVAPLSLTGGIWYLGAIATPAGGATNSTRVADTGPVTVPLSSKSQSYIGVFRGGQWHLNVIASPQWAPATDFVGSFGLPGDIPVVGDWDGSGRKKMGVFRNGTWFLDKNGNGQWDGPGIDIQGTFGLPGDIPVVGDWTGSGTTKVGVFRNGTWILDKSGTANFNSATVIIGSFGLAGDTPVVGDWTGSGTSKVGIFRGGLWVLDKSGSANFNSATVIVGNFGLAGDIPVVGDWTGSGSAKAGIFRVGLWVLDRSGTANFNSATATIGNFGLAGDTPMAGDWTGSGTAKVGVFRGGEWFLDTSGTANYNSATTSAGSFGLPGDVPVAGHWR